MNNIDILEEFINDYKKVQEKYKDDEIQAEIERSCYFEEVPYQAIETLIAENKELKEEVERQGVARAIEGDYIEKNFINKNEIKEEIQELKNMKIDGEVFKTAVNYAIKILQSLLGKE